MDLYDNFFKIHYIIPVFDSKQLFIFLRIISCRFNFFYFQVSLQSNQISVFAKGYEGWQGTFKK